jgi:hypothetical protein
MNEKNHFIAGNGDVSVLSRNENIFFLRDLSFLLFLFLYDGKMNKELLVVWRVLNRFHSGCITKKVYHGSKGSESLFCPISQFLDIISRPIRQNLLTNVFMLSQF